MGRLARFIHFYTDNDLGNGDDKYPVNKVFGTSPLTLTNALAKKLKSLVQYGKCSVSGSTITCNNGVLSVVNGEIVTTGTPEEIKLEGKNIADMSSLVDWDDRNGLTLTKNPDGSFVLDGTATATTYQTIQIPLSAGTYILSGCPQGGGTSGYSLFMGSPINKYDTGSGIEFTIAEDMNAPLIIPRVINGTECDNLLFKPMIRLASDTDDTFVPHTAQTATAPNLYAVDGVTDEVDLIKGTLTHRTEAVISDGTTPSGRYVGTVGEGNVIVKALEETYSDDDPITFTEEKEREINALIAEFSPVQDLHGQDAPYPAGGGKNICPDKMYSSSGNAVYIGQDNGTDFPFALSGGQSYSVSFVCSKSLSIYLREENQSGGVQIQNTFTPSATGNYRIAFTNSGGISPSEITNVQVELGSTATPFAPYENICPIEGFTGITAYDDPKYGGNIWWNQIIKNNSILSKAEFGITGTNNTDGTYTISGTATNGNFDAYVNLVLIIGHIYALWGCPKSGSDSTYYLYCSGNRDTGDGVLFTTDSASRTVDIIVRNGTVISEPVVFAPKLADLTAMFGAGNEPATVEAFKALFPKAYYPYNAGEVSTVSKVNEEPYKEIPVTFPVVSANQWDEEWELGTYSAQGVKIDSTTQIRSKNKIPVKPGTSYYITFSTGAMNNICFYDANEEFISNTAAGTVRAITTPANAYYMAFQMNGTYGTTYLHDIAVNYPSSVTTYNQYSNTIYGGYLRINRDGSVDAVAEFRTRVLNGTSGSFSNFSERTDTCRVLNYNFSDQKPNNTSEKTILSDSLTPYVPDWLVNRDVEGICENKHTTTAGIWISVQKSKLAEVSLDGMKGWLSANNVQVGYPLATPIVYHLDPVDPPKTLQGVNNWWSTANGDLTLYIALDAVVEQIAKQQLSTSEGTNTMSWTAEVEDKEMSVEYRTNEAPQQVQMLGMSAPPNLNLNAPTLQPIGGIGDIQPAVLNPLTIEDEVVNEEPEDEPADVGEEEVVEEPAEDAEEQI
jgi:hypothetical protein